MKLACNGWLRWKFSSAKSRAKGYTKSAGTMRLTKLLRGLDGFADDKWVRCQRAQRSHCCLVLPCAACSFRAAARASSFSRVPASPHRPDRQEAKALSGRNGTRHAAARRENYGNLSGSVSSGSLVENKHAAVPEHRTYAHSGAGTLVESLARLRKRHLAWVVGGRRACIGIDAFVS